MSLSSHKFLNLISFYVKFTYNILCQLSGGLDGTYNSQ